MFEWIELEYVESKKDNNYEVIKPNLLNFIKTYFIAGTMTFAIVMIYTFMLAYQNVGYKTMVHINNFREAHIEAIMIILYFISIIILTINAFMENKK